MNGTNSIDPIQLITPKRAICGASAVLLPFSDSGEVEWSAFRRLLARTAEAGLLPAVNMDTGYVNLLGEDEKKRVLEETRAVLGGERFFAGAYVTDRPGDAFNEPAYAEQTALIHRHGGTPVVFQSYGLAHAEDDAVIENYRAIASHCDEFLAFELGTMFAQFGKIYSDAVFRALLHIKSCTGAKHSSLCRETEWSRLATRNQVRPDFRIYTGNDLAIDMVVYGSDYLLGLAAFAPDVFAKRDALWKEGDSRWNTSNDFLQSIGAIAFREPVPAYKHSAAMFLHARGWLPGDATHPRSPTRGEEDRVILERLARQARNYTE